ncbi:MAG: undecaprenyl/decaprenyl-phosphate alpha-N-acetylglucosaminyl 1-phosphate transferase [Chlorobium sp.]|uniref:MraY family glycosyltransferase n=1 Tax=Chlorobium sp. TaxID=1095 RepID=UPI0025C1F6AD|nr:MraY family glycosyltransferase [Chlorobium sp.]MCF8383440.1 undecaprenyl/decaprenyl-phosphate alpha-N-acetylglucosaminyl 1-phosphate transferase [Chlorobium sp.]
MLHYLLILLLGVFLAGLSAVGQFAFGSTDEQYWVSFLTRSMEHVRIYAVALFVAHLSILGLAASASKLKLLDIPDNNRKVHDVAKPLVGGLGIIAGVLVAMLLFFPVVKYMSFMISILLILGVGVLDDRFDISFKWRFVVQITASIITIYYFPGMRLNSFGNLVGLGPIETGLVMFPVTIFCILGVINAINMIDGLDGLAGTTSLASFTAFAVLAWLNDMSAFMLLSLAFVGAIAAFLRFNWYPSKLFMGDAGSMTIGFVLAFFAIELTQKPGSIVSPVASLLVLSIPVTDTLAVMVKRMMRGKSPFEPDKTHFHHILRDMGFGHAGVVIIIMSLSVLFSSLAIIGTIMRVPDYMLFGIFLCWFIYYFVSSSSRMGLFSVIDSIRKIGYLKRGDA